MPIGIPFGAFLPLKNNVFPSIMIETDQPLVNIKPYTSRFPSAVKIEVTRAIIRGELFLEEAMIKYSIADRRTVIRWLKNCLKEQGGNIKKL